MSHRTFQWRPLHLLLLLLWCGAANAGGGDSSLSHLHVSFARILRSDAHAASLFHVVIRLKEPPLPPLSLPSNSERSQAREAVAVHLQQHRRSAQAAIREFLFNSSCEFFWIANRISCVNVSVPTLRALSQRPDVAALHPPSAIRRPLPVRNADSSPATSLRASDLQPNIHQIAADAAWSVTQGQGVTIAVIDGGARYTHEALQSSYRGTSSDGSFDHDYNWIDYAYHNKEPYDSDEDGHGTHVTGLAAGANGIGVAPKAKWVHACACNFAGYCSDDWALQSCQWVMCPTKVDGSAANCSRGADVVSCSWGADDDDDPYLIEAVDAWLQAGIVPVFAVGNSGPDCDSVASPSDYPGVLGVGAVDANDMLTGFSSRGAGGYKNKTDTTPAVVAPGLNVVSASNKDDSKYHALSGTSQACPHAAGVAALVLSLLPKATPYEVISIIANSSSTATLHQPDTGKDSCDGIAWNAWPNDIYGHGRLDAENAVKKALEVARARG